MSGWLLEPAREKLEREIAESISITSTQKYDAFRAELVYTSRQIKNLCVCVQRILLINLIFQSNRINQHYDSARLFRQSNLGNHN